MGKVRALHWKMQQVCGHRGVGRDSTHADNRKGPLIEASFLLRQLEAAYETAVCPFPNTLVCVLASGRGLLA